MTTNMSTSMTTSMSTSMTTNMSTSRTTNMSTSVRTSMSTNMSTSMTTNMSTSMSSNMMQHDHRKRNLFIKGKSTTRILRLQKAWLWSGARATLPLVERTTACASAALIQPRKLEPSKAR
ncbi:hypothetical protein FHG87_024148 [Trinorchestia longiramus]|nr:hypothetical protein FHG87_024148 [Trinorchestia longiramus]